MRRLDLARALAGVAGVVLAHIVDYEAVFPVGRVRARSLAGTGHDYWRVAIGAAVASAVVCLVVAVVRSAAFALRCEESEHRRSFLAQAAALARFQVVVFTALESLERFHAGHSPWVLLHERTFLLGCLLQLVLAGVATLLIGGIELLTARVVTALCARRAPFTRIAGTSPAVSSAERHGLAASTSRSRAPPLPI